MADLRLSIADFVIELVNESDDIVALEDGYLPFVTNENAFSTSIKIHAHSGISPELKTLENVIYSAEFEGNCLWKIARVDDGLRFHVFNPEAPFELQQVAVLNADMTEWTIYSEPVQKGRDSKIIPLLYPMGPLVMYYLTVKFEAVMIHGSGVSDNGNGRIFTGVSGRGKTTMAKLWFDAGAEVLNDDRLIIRRNEEGYVVYNTPMFYQDKPRFANLTAIYSIHHSKTNNLIELKGTDAVAAVLPNLIQHGYQSELINHHLNFVTEMIDKISIYNLGFVPDESVVQKVKDVTLERA